MFARFTEYHYRNSSDYIYSRNEQGLNNFLTEKQIFQFLFAI